jgi:Flp pilus assembly protein TadG
MRRRERRGSIVVLVAVLMVVLLGFGAFAVDVAQMQAYKSELKRTADAAVLAAAKELLTPNPSNALAMASTYVTANPVMGTTAEIVEVAYGTYDPMSSSFTAAVPTVANAFQITVRSSGDFYLAQLIGGRDFDVNATATAWLPVTARPCAAPWALLEANFLAQTPSGFTDFSLRALPLNLTPGPNSAAYVLKESDAVGLPWSGAVNLPPFQGSFVPGTVGYAQNILAGILGGPCHNLNPGDLLQAKVAPVFDNATIDGASGGGVVNLCASLRGDLCYNHGGQLGVAVRIPIVQPVSGNPACVTTILDPLDMLTSGLAMCFDVVGVRTFVVVSAIQSGPQRGQVIGLYAGDDSQGPVLGYAQRPILVQ